MAFRIVLVDPISEKFQGVFGALVPEGYSFECPNSATDLDLLLPDADVVLTRHTLVSEELIQAAGSNLKLVQVMGRLPDRVDLDAARRARTPVATMPHVGAQAVAEHAFALMLALTRQLVRGHLGVVNGDYRRRNLDPALTSEDSFAFNWLGFDNVAELRGKTLGVVGFGEIGREMARRGRAFDMKILYNQRRRLRDGYEKTLGARFLSLDDLLAESDFVSLHTPQTPETEGLLNRRRLELLRPGAYLINTARGAVIDENALADLLRNRRIAGAGLDVFVREPLPHEHPLACLDNVILAPHTGGGAGGGQRQHFLDILENIARLRAGRQPHHLVS